ncbi:LysM peptidoglycan-binding domain-containing protein [Ochrobactrum chromiisoli]|uniref:Peptidoglycan-binding protein LysM n=1 Tax=Ochrobactrum chromiisoli TaxID=2993941 RepID=A0ABT3QS59_9HYPH|nr:LysM peptidoglycan-binding domain-containing protein [Ochrobactrum chromiisoli]MCX2698454.1 peptidoglycan-binding protein LysM [Ochrobactrum chromiisoli]
MAYRIDGNARNRFDESGEKATPIPAAQAENFRRDIEIVSREREGGNNNGKPDTGERVFVVESGDTLEGIARENQADIAETMAINANESNHNGDLIHPDDIVILPAPEPEQVAASKPDVEGEPSAEDAFIQSLYDRGNQIEYAKPEDGIDHEAETQALRDDVAAYLDALPPEARQDAAIRLSQKDWTDAGPAGIAVEDVVTAAGLHEDPVNAFADELYQRGNALEYADPSADVDHSLETTALSEDIEGFLNSLPEGERREALQNLYDRSWTDAGPAQIAIEETARSTGIKLSPTGHNGPEIESEVRAVVDNATAETGEAEAQFSTFVDGYNKASPEVQNALLRQGYADEFMTSMADYATEPMHDYDPATSEQQKPYQTFLRLEAMTENTPPEVAADLVTTAMPEIDRVNTLYQEQSGYPMLGYGGVESMLKVAERIEGTPQGDHVIEQWAEMGFYQRDQITQSIGNGGSLQYPLELAETHDSSTAMLEQDILPGVRQNQSVTNSAVEDYSVHMEELRWLIDNHGDTMTPEQLEQAIIDYKAEKGDEWNAENERLEAAVNENGEILLDQITQLGEFPDEPKEQKDLINKEIENILNDDRSYLAIQSALRNNPELIDKPEVLNFLGQEGRLTDRGRKLAEEVFTQVVQRNVLPEFEDFKGASPEKMGEIRDSLAEFRDSKYAALLGVTDKDMNKAIDAIEEAIPLDTDSPAAIEGKMAKLDKSLSKLDSGKQSGIRTFSTSTVPGQVLRMIGATGAAMTLYNSARTAGNEPNIENILKTSYDAAGLWQRSVEIRNGLGMMDADSFAVQNFDGSLKPGTKILGVIGAVFDGVNSYQAFADGNPELGITHGLTAVGGVTAALAPGTILGPIGVGVVIIGTIATMMVTDVQESNKYDNELSQNFLERSGLDAEAADALVDQSGEGYSPVPILLEYAEAKGYDMANADHRTAVIDWINAMSPEQLATLRDNLHHTIDEFKGDPSQLQQTAPDDADYTDDAEYNKVEIKGSYNSTIGERYNVQAGNASPSSVVQIDVVLETLKITDLPAAPVS